MQHQTLNIQNKIIIDNFTQRTASFIAGKGSGKTTMLLQFMKELKGVPVLVFDPLGVINNDSLNAIQIKLKTKDIDEERITSLMKVVNKALRDNKHIVLSFNNMIDYELIELANMIIPKLRLKNAVVMFDEIHTFSPLHSGSSEVERYARHCRNSNIFFVMTTQRSAAVSKNVLAMSDYVLLGRTTWANDLEATKKLIQNIIPKEEVSKILSDLPTLKFMEWYTIDYRKSEQ